MKDFFISYNKADRAWAEWVAWILEEADYSIIIQAWDFRPGENFVLRMQEAAEKSRQTIAIVSNEYLNARYTSPEWAAAFAKDPQGENQRLILIKVNPCEPGGLLMPIISIDLVGLSEEAARQAILESVKKRAKPSTAPEFPPMRERQVKEPVHFPGGTQQQKTEIPSNLPTGITLFVGREEILNQLRHGLAAGDPAPGRIQAITGLGGIGKTQTAIEYARRFADDYTALLWAVAESSESLRSDFVAIAGILNLPEAQLQDQTSALNAVKRWFTTNEGWLLILDNADDVSLLSEFIPQGFKGSILLTSRAQVFDSVGILNPIELDSLTPEEAKDFLVRRTGLTDLDKNESEAAEQLAAELDYLPLALEQAAAYIKQLKGSFPDYLNSYRKRGLELLEKGQASGLYRKSVRTTWSLNFQQVAESSTASADFLRVSAFLNPDRIPTELFAEGAEELGPDIASSLREVKTDPLVLDELMQPPVNFSLIHRDRRARTYDIHRLVQAVLLDVMDEPTKLLWTNRVAQALERIFLSVDASPQSEWIRIERLVPHVQRLADFGFHFSLGTREAVKLFNKAGRYLHLRGRLQESEKLYDKALTIADRLGDRDDLDLAASLHNKGWLLYDLGQCDNAEPLLRRALEIRERVQGTEHADVAPIVSKLGAVYEDQGRFKNARECYQRALTIAQAQDDQIRVAENLINLASLHYEFVEYPEAKTLIEKGIKILESNIDGMHHALGPAFNALGAIRITEGKLEDAETALRQSIAIYETLFGSDYPRIAISLQSLGRVHIKRQEYDQAEEALHRSLRIRETAFGPDHPEIALSLTGLADLRIEEGKFAEAEALLQRALDLNERSLGINNPAVSDVLYALVKAYNSQKKFLKAEPFARRLLAIRRDRHGLNSTKTTNAMMAYAETLWGMNRKGEAQRLRAQAVKIQGKRANKKRRH